MNSLDTRLEAAFRRPEPSIGDDGFTEGVMRALPGKRFVGAKAGRLTLGAAAVTGGLLTSLLGAPLGNTLSSIVPAGGYVMPLIAVIFITMVAVPTVWVLYSE